MSTAVARWFWAARSHVMAAKTVAFTEALRPEFRTYARTGQSVD